VHLLARGEHVDILDVARAHQCTITRRNGDWEFLETPELTQAKQEIKNLKGALDILSKPFPDHELLTSRERATLTQIVRGASNKEAARPHGLLHRLFLFLITLVALFFVFRNGARLADRVLDTVDRLLGDPGEPLASKIADAIRGTVNGTVAVALAEAAIIGIGYVLAGVPIHSFSRC
jgi:predicted PurR-regulated permease PerM